MSNNPISAASDERVEKIRISNNGCVFPDSTISELIARIDELKAELKEAREEVNEQARLNGAGSQREFRLQSDLREARRQLEEAKRERDTLVQHHNNVVAERDALKREGERLKTAANEWHENNVAVEAQNRDLQRWLDEEQAEIARLESIISDAHACLNSREARIAHEDILSAWQILDDAVSSFAPADEPGESRAFQLGHSIGKHEMAQAELTHQPQASPAPQPATAPERNQCDGCARGLLSYPSEFSAHPVHRGPGEWDLQSCTAHLYGHKPAIPSKEPATVTPDLGHAITLLGDAVYKLCVQHSADHGDSARVKQAMRFVDEAQALSRLESRADSEESK